MKYRITIQKITEKPVIKQVYISDEELKSRGIEAPRSQDNYRDCEVMELVNEMVYEQTRENELDLMGVIAAFNKDSA